MTVREALEKFGGDKRTREYKNIISQLRFPLEDYNKLKELAGREKMSWEETKWLFDFNNEVFNRNDTACRCGGIIRRMLVKLIKTWERKSIMPLE